MTGGDRLTARFMRQDFFTYRPQFKLTIIGNHKPVLRSVDEAARRRFNIGPFLRKPTNPDPQLEAKLKTEWPGILRWMIDGCLAWQAGGLIRPESVREATAEYFSGQDLFGQWLEDECDVEPGNPYKMGTSAELFSSWQTYASKAGEPPGSRRAFADNLARRGISHYRNFGGRGFKGIRLRTSQGRQDHDA